MAVDGGQHLRQVRAVLARAGVEVGAGDPVERLPSASNVVFRVGDVVVRLAARTRVGVERRAEVTNMRRASDEGLAPEVLAWSDDGALVTRLVQGVALRPSDAADHLDEVGRLLRRVHDGDAFVGLHDPWRMSDLLAARGATDDACDQLASRLDAFRFPPSVLAPCHGDPWPGNIVGSGDELLLVDWEYSGMGDPLWDVADFAVESDLGGDAEVVLLTAYLGREPEDALMHRLRTYRCLADLLWARWSLEEHAEGNLADDFLAEARRRSVRGWEASLLLVSG